MSNLVISRICNLSCSYCFANDFMQFTPQTDKQLFISMKDFEKNLVFLKHSGIRDLRLIGGEPTLHPQFCELVELGRKKGFHILVFTHGLLKESIIHYLEGLSESDCTLLINMNARGKEKREFNLILNQRLETMLRLHHLTAPGFNINIPDFDLGPIIDAIKRTGCRQVIRIGLAHPTLTAQNRYLHPKQYSFVASKIVQFAEFAFEEGIRFEFDCGYVRCMFSNDELATLKKARSNVHFQCSPILDVDLNNQAYHCFPLASKYSIEMDSHSYAPDLRDRIMQQAQMYRAAGIYPTCSTCGFKERNECAGGCLAITMHRFRPASVNIPWPISAGY